MEDEVLVKQPDGSLKLVKVSELGAVTAPKPAPTPAAVFVPAIERYDQTAEELVRQSGVAVAPELRQRLKVVVISRLKDIRKKIETVEKLQAPKEQGGLGLNALESEKILKLVEEKKGVGVALTPMPLKALPPEDAHGPHQADLAVVSPPPKPVPSISSPSPLPPPPPSRPRAGPTPTSADVRKNAPPAIKIVQPQNASSLKIEPTKLPPLPPKPLLTMAIPQTATGKSKVEDVAYRPRLVGPLDELQSLTLVDWRRLSSNPSVAADKIYAKVELLAATSFEEKVKGIRAWQSSEVNRLYLEILNDSLTKLQPLNQVISERDAAMSLTQADWQAVMELNRRLRL